MDVHPPLVRSKNMRAIRYKDTQPEMSLRRALHAKGFRFRLNVRSLPGTPDIVLPKYHATIFVHGCFWHGHHCHLFKLPQTRKEFWQSKIAGNMRRDIIAREKLLAAGWRVAIVWECALKGRHRLSIDALISELAAWIADTRSPSVEFYCVAVADR
jgi:DNA mismatch endonuclease (patch repair protein)